MPRQGRAGDGIVTRADRKGYYINYLDQHGTLRQVKAKGSTKDAARKQRAAILTRVEQAKLLGFTPPGEDKFAEVAERYLAYQRARLTPRAYDRATGIVRLHLIPHFRGKIASVKKQLVQRYVTKRLAKVSAHTVKKELDIIKHIFKLAIEWEIIPVSPATTIKSPKVPPGRVRYLEANEVQRVMQSAPVWLRPIIIFAIGTGARRGTILNLQWRDVVPARVTFMKTKAGRRHTVPQNEMTRMALAMVWHPDVQPEDYVFGLPTDTEKVSKAFLRACRKAKITDMRLHDLRHTCASWLAMSGEDIRTIAQLLDHSDIRMTMKYAHLSPSYLQESVKALDRIFIPVLNKQLPETTP